MIVRITVAIACLSLLLSPSLVAAQVDAAKIEGRPPVQDIRVPKRIHYEVRSYAENEPTRANEMAFFVPRKHLEDSEARLPVIVFLHGGGWRNGDKDQCYWLGIQAADSGFIGVTVSYRLIGEAPFPACIQDVMQALRYLKSECTDLPIDPERVGIEGYSAGGHLALLAALAPDHAAFDSGVFSGVSARVDCAFAVSAPTDMIQRLQRRGDLNFLTAEQNKDLAFVSLISPVSHIHADQVPIFMIQGTADPIVQPYHAESFKAACEEAGVAHFDLRMHPEGRHNVIFEESATYRPLMIEFFREHLQ
jgi:acetyl esterase/lipase